MKPAPGDWAMSGPSQSRMRQCAWRSLWIAAQHEAVSAHFPALEPVEKAHAEQVRLQLALRHHQRRHRILDQPADRKVVERQPRALGVAGRGLEIDVVIEQLER